MPSSTSHSRGLSYDLIARLIFILSGYAMNIGLARILGPEEYGNALLIINVILIFNVFMTNGLYQGLVKYSGNPDINLQDLWKKAIFLQLITSGILVSINLLISWPLANIFGEPDMLYPFLLLAIIIPANGLFYCQIGMLNGMHKFKEQATANVIYSVARVVFIFGILFVFNLPLYAIIIGTFIGYALAYYYSSTQWHYNSGTEIVRPRTLFNDAMRFIGLFIFITLFMNVDFFLLKSLCNDKTLIGQYGAMINIGKMIYFFIFSFTNTFYPISLKLYFENNVEQIKTKLIDINSILIAFSFVSVIGTFYFDKEIIQLLFGTEYVHEDNILVLYCVSIILLSVSVLYAHILSVFGYKRAPIYAFAAAMIMFVVASVLFYDLSGVYSILYSFIACQLILFAYLSVLLHLNLSNHLPVRYIAIAAIITGLTIAPFSFFDIPQSFALRFIISSVGIGAVVLSSYSVLELIRKLISNVFPTLNK